MNRNIQLLKAWQKILMTICERTIAFQKILIYNRRLSLKRLRRRQILLRHHYFQRLIDVQNQFLLRIPRPVRKRYWREKRTSEFWYYRVQKEFSESDWLDNFRMNKQTFMWLCNQLKNELTPKCSLVRKPIPLEMRVAMSLYKLSTGAEYRIVSELFGVARSTVCKFLRLFCETVVNKISKTQITMPTFDEVLQIQEQFKQYSKLPLICGGIGYTHIPINPPAEGFENFINTGGWPSIVFQAVIDNNLLFRKIELNSREPSLYTDTNDEIPQIEKIIDKHRVNYYLVGNPSYPLLKWLVKQYANPNNLDELYFNQCINKLNTLTESAFRRLFARWHVLTRKTDIEYRNMPYVLTACSTLHNIIERNKDGYKSSWEMELNPSYNDFQPQDFVRPVLPDTEEGVHLRKILTEYLKSKFQQLK